MEIVTDSGSVKGEVLKFSWGIGGGLLVSNIDIPQNTTWVKTDCVRKVYFLNPGIVKMQNLLDQDTHKLLNTIHPGYGDEVEQKLKRKTE